MKRVAFSLALILSFSCAAYAAIEISTDHRALFFDVMQLGEEKELAQLGSYHNQITCSSTNGYTWNLKINLLQPFAQGQEAIPLDSFKWQLAWTDGNGTVFSPYQFKAFSLIPDLAYISGANESAGNTINLQFKYYLKIPESQVSGVYNTAIRFTLTEAL